MCYRTRLYLLLAVITHWIVISKRSQLSLKRDIGYEGSRPKQLFRNGLVVRLDFGTVQIDNHVSLSQIVVPRPFILLLSVQ